MTYRAPVDDILFSLKTAVDFDGMVASGVYADLDDATLRAILEEAGKFGSEVLDPLNWTGDRAGSHLKNGTVTTPPGWREAYKAFVEGGWNALPCPETHGGQGLPSIVASAVGEIWNSSNLAFGLCPLLTQGAIHALEATGSDALKAQYLPRMISGEWTGTMNLTEPHAGSDVGSLTTRAERRDDGTYRIFGTKIYITYGEHELTDNIIHFVLARLPDAPAGTRGISLFLVPKRLVAPDGSLGERNDVICAGVEHKLGIHASPTCTMKYGETSGAVGYLVGEENKGLAAMFIMMNAARLAVGIQGVAIAERAMQRAQDYARERRQGRTHWNPKSPQMAAIIEHPDIRRTLATMRALTAASRAICLVTSSELDRAERAADPAERQRGAMRAALLTPVAKAYSTDIGVEVASMGVQVHGGMGFVEETGAAQHYRDARILPIYEGTNGIQAIDLATRKVPLEGGAVVRGYIGEIKETADALARVNDPVIGQIAERVAEAASSLERATEWLLAKLQTGQPADMDAVLASATPYLRLFGIAAGAHYLGRGALKGHRDGRAGDGSGPVRLAHYFAMNHVPEAVGLERVVTAGADPLLADTADRLSA